MKRPSFQLYPKDFLADRKVVVMTNDQVGGYFKLLCHMWLEDDCSLPNEPEELMALSGLDERSLEKVLRCFIALRSQTDRITHKRLMEEREKQDENRKKKSAAGAKGNEIRWGKPKNEPSQCDPNAIAKDRSSSPSSTSLKKINKKKNYSFGHPIAESLWKTLEDECGKLGFKNDVNKELFEQTYHEFSTKLPTGAGFGKQIRDCLFWHRDKGQKIVIRTLTIRNWLKNAVKFSKEAELRRMTADKDKIQTQDSIKSLAQKMSWE